MTLSFLNCTLIKRAILICLCTLSALSSFSQYIKGEIRTNESWRNKLYLIEISNYDQVWGGSSQYVIDSFDIDNDGAFCSNRLKKSTFYRLNVIPAGEKVPGMIIQNGVMDNYAFFATDESNDTLKLSADISALYRSYSVKSKNRELDNLQQQIKTIIKIKMPLSDTMQSLGENMQQLQPSDTQALFNFQQKAMLQLQELDTKLNQRLAILLDTATHPLILSFGLVNYGFLYNIDNIVQKTAQKLSRYKNIPFAASIHNKIASHVQSGTDNSFLKRTYTLIDDSLIQLDTLSTHFILLDFWASWCLPCRKAINTTLKSLYKQYDINTLRIIGVATDEVKEDALKAIVKDQNPFLQIYENQQGFLANWFNVEHLPFYVLINTKTGTIHQNIIAPELIADKINEERSKP